MSEPRYCIIGAGYVGNGVARAFKQAGISYDQLEATDHIGGNWAHGVYDSTHLISSRAGTAYAGFPMPTHYPDFPSRAQMLAYLESFVDHYGLRQHIEFNAEVVSCRPLDAHGLSGWRVELAGGEVREYAGVVVVNGHDWKMRRPTYPGNYVGQQLHSKQYRGPADLDGDRVLVVGGGNSACDVAVETALTRGGCDISMRSGSWFSPKLFVGVPVAEWDRLWLPRPLARLLARSMIRARFGSWERYGLPRPTRKLFETEPVVNEQLLYYLRHGKVTARPGIDRFDGHYVHFVDGTTGSYDAIVWATGFEVGFPFLDERLFRWEGGNPVLIERLLAPGLANLYLYGLLKPRGGSGRLIAEGADLLVRLIRAQQRLDGPLADVAAKVLPETTSMLVGISEMLRVFDKAATLADTIVVADEHLPELARTTASRAPAALLRPGLAALTTPRWIARTAGEIATLAKLAARQLQAGATTKVQTSPQCATAATNDASVAVSA